MRLDVIISGFILIWSDKTVFSDDRTVDDDDIRQIEYETSLEQWSISKSRKRSSAAAKGRAGVGFDCNSLVFTRDTTSRGISLVVDRAIVPAYQMNWFDAICCCRSRNQQLTSPYDIQDIIHLNDEVKVLPAKFYWVDTNAISGVWKSFLTGTGIIDFFRYQAALNIYVPTINVSTSLCAHGNGKHGTYAKKCNEPISVPSVLICEETNQTPTDNCFGPPNAKECTPDNVISYVQTGICPRAIPAPSATTTKPTAVVTTTKPTAAATTTKATTATTTTTSAPVTVAPNTNTGSTSKCCCDSAFSFGCGCPWWSNLFG